MLVFVQKPTEQTEPSLANQPSDVLQTSLLLPVHHLHQTSLLQKACSCNVHHILQKAFLTMDVVPLDQQAGDFQSRDGHVVRALGCPVHSLELIIIRTASRKG